MLIQNPWRSIWAVMCENVWLSTSGSARLAQHPVYLFSACTQHSKGGTCSILSQQSTPLVWTRLDLSPWFPNFLISHSLSATETSFQRLNRTFLPVELWNLQSRHAVLVQQRLVGSAAMTDAKDHHNKVIAIPFTNKPPKQLQQDHTVLYLASFNSSNSHF